MRTTTKQLEARLKETLERYELVSRATHDVIYDLDLQAGTVAWNSALHSQYGYSLSDEVATVEWWTAHIHPDDAFRVQEEITALIETDQETWQSEYRFQKADSSYAFVRDRAFLIRDKQGRIQRIIGSFLDITQQRQLDRAKDEFLSLVSHQLRTPLTIVRMLSGILASGKAGPLNHRQREYTEQIADASSRMVRIVSDILNISRLELGRVRIQPILTDVNVLIQTYVNELAPLAAEKGVSLSFKPSRGLKPIPLDGPVFGQILHNLLTNALRYTAPKNGQVMVAFRRARNDFILSVHDNGIGIPRVDQPHIFDRFYRADNAVEVDAGGTGLGLYLIKLIVDTFNGQVWVESKKGQGATFFVRLPKTGMQARNVMSRAAPSDFQS